MARASLSIKLDTADITAAMRYVDAQTLHWRSARREALYGELQALVEADDAQCVTSEILPDGSPVFVATVSPAFLQILDRHGLGGPKIPEVSR